MESRSKPDEQKTIQRSEHWFQLPVGAPAAKHIVDYGKALLTIERGFHLKNLARERMYRGVDLLSNRAALSILERGGYGVARLNVIKAVCDTFSSRLSKDRPMPSFVTDDSDWQLKQQAKRFREFIVGQMLETEFDDLSRYALDDGTILGSGFTRIDDNDDSIFAESIPLNELLFDRRECKYGKPLQAIRLQRVSKSYLKELFPKSKDAIERAPSSTRRPDDDDVDGNGTRLGSFEDYVDTWEAWHPPTLPGGKDGRHVLCFDSEDPKLGTLVSELWYEPRFPWTQFQITKPKRGIYPEGFVDHLADMQHSVNRIVRDIQLNLRATGRGFFLVHEASDVPVEMMSGFQPFKMKYRGAQAPTWNAPTPFNPAQMNALDKFIDLMFRLEGVSQANAESRSSLGPGASGVALDTQYDIDSDRFRMPQANYARYRLNGAQCYLDAAARVARRRQEGKGAKRSWVAVSWKGRDAIQRLDYTKVMLKDGDYRLRIEPVGFIPDTRAGKISVVEQLAKAGVIPQWIVPALFDEPDLSEANRIVLAPYKNCLRKMDELVDTSIPPPIPEQYNDLDLELKVATAFYNWVQAEKAPAEIETRFRNYVDMVVYELKKRSAPPPVPPALGAPGPQPMLPPGGNPAAMGIPPGPPPGPQGPLPPMPGGIPLMPNGPLPPPPTIGAVPPS